MPKLRLLAGSDRNGALQWASIETADQGMRTPIWLALAFRRMAHEAVSMAALLKSESSADQVGELVALEDLADRCFHDVQLLGAPRNLASWAALTRLVQLIEPAIEKFGTPYTREFVATIINAGRSGSLLLEWIQKHGAERLAPRSRFRWSAALETTAAQAFDLAHNYEVFTGCFPAWHRDRAAAEIVAPRTVRFTWLGGASRTSRQRVPEGIPSRIRRTGNGDSILPRAGHTDDPRPVGKGP